MSEVQRQIIDLLHEEHGIARSKLIPTARIWHDLGVDGDDVGDLLQRLHELFGTDFTALDDQWLEFFNYEGASPRSCVLGLALLIPSVAGAIWISETFELSRHGAGLLTVAVFFGLWFLLGRLFPSKPKRPLTIAGLANIVDAGHWPRSPTKVN